MKSNSSTSPASPASSLSSPRFLSSAVRPLSITQLASSASSSSASAASNSSTLTSPRASSLGTTSSLYETPSLNSSMRARLDAKSPPTSSRPTFSSTATLVSATPSAAASVRLITNSASNFTVERAPRRSLGQSQPLTSASQVAIHPASPLKSSTNATAAMLHKITSATSPMKSTNPNPSSPLSMSKLRTSPLKSVPTASPPKSSVLSGSETRRAIALATYAPTSSSSSPLSPPRGGSDAAAIDSFASRFAVTSPGSKIARSPAGGSARLNSLSISAKLPSADAFEEMKIRAAATVQDIMNQPSPARSRYAQLSATLGSSPSSSSSFSPGSSDPRAGKGAGAPKGIPFDLRHVPRMIRSPEEEARSERLRAIGAKVREEQQRAQQAAKQRATEDWIKRQATSALQSAERRAIATSNRTATESSNKSQLPSLPLAAAPSSQPKKGLAAQVTPPDSDEEVEIQHRDEVEEEEEESSPVHHQRATVSRVLEDERNEQKYAEMEEEQAALEAENEIESPQQTTEDPFDALEEEDEQTHQQQYAEDVERAADEALAAEEEAQAVAEIEHEIAHQTAQASREDDLEITQRYEPGASEAEQQQQEEEQFTDEAPVDSPQPIEEEAEDEDEAEVESKQKQHFDEKEKEEKDEDDDNDSRYDTIDPRLVAASTASAASTSETPTSYPRLERFASDPVYSSSNVNSSSSNGRSSAAVSGYSSVTHSSSKRHSDLYTDTHEAQLTNNNNIGGSVSAPNTPFISSQPMSAPARGPLRSSSLALGLSATTLTHSSSLGSDRLFGSAAGELPPLIDEEFKRHRADVVIIGAGLSGIAAATHFCETHAKLQTESPESTSKRKYSIAILEASNRVGGRTYTRHIEVSHADVNDRTKTKDYAVQLDLGGQWVAEDHTCIQDLAKKWGCPLEKQYHDGLKLVEQAEKVYTYAGDLPSHLSWWNLLKLQLLIWKLDKLAKQVVASADDHQASSEAARAYAKANGLQEAPSMFFTPSARLIDSQTVASWSLANVSALPLRKLLEATIRGLFGAEANEISMLQFLNYIAANGGSIEKLINIPKGNQEYYYKHGAQTLSEKMALAFGIAPEYARVGLHFNQQVRIIRNAITNPSTSPAIKSMEAKSPSHPVEILTHDSLWSARYVIIACPPPVYSKIEFEPSLPPLQRSLCTKSFMGSIIKVVLLYSRAWWRENGFSGEGFSADNLPLDAAPIFQCYDGSRILVPAVYNEKHQLLQPEILQPGLVLFINGQNGALWSFADETFRREAILNHLATWFVSAAKQNKIKSTALTREEIMQPIFFEEKDWGNDPYVVGCPVSNYPPGLLWAASAELRKPFGRIHFAGTESSTFGTGFMEGAARSGQRAATEVFEALQAQARLRRAKRAQAALGQSQSNDERSSKKKREEPEQSWSTTESEASDQELDSKSTVFREQDRNTFHRSAQILTSAHVNEPGHSVYSSPNRKSTSPPSLAAVESASALTNATKKKQSHNKKKTRSCCDSKWLSWFIAILLLILLVTGLWFETLDTRTQNKYKSQAITYARTAQTQLDVATLPYRTEALRFYRESGAEEQVGIMIEVSHALWVDAQSKYAQLIDEYFPAEAIQVAFGTANPSTKCATTPGLRK